VKYVDPDGRDIVWSESWLGLKSGGVQAARGVLNAFLFVGEVFSATLGGAAGRFDESLDFHLLSADAIAKDRAQPAASNEKLKETLARALDTWHTPRQSRRCSESGRRLRKRATSVYEAISSEGPNPEASRAAASTVRHPIPWQEWQGWALAWVRVRSLAPTETAANLRFERTGANGRERSLAFAMQKVVGSSPIIRLRESLACAGLFCWRVATAVNG
jgi:hypothetical protein